MARNKRKVNADQETVFGVLLDPHAYSDWVVGAYKVRDVDADWPAEGSSFHHQLARSSGGAKDKTTIIDIERPRQITLKAYARPLGAVEVKIRVEQVDSASLVVIDESPAKDSKLRQIKRLLDVFIYLRNIDSLRRLARIAEDRITT